jgi:hypothetical protein
MPNTRLHHILLAAHCSEEYRIDPYASGEHTLTSEVEVGLDPFPRSHGSLLLKLRNHLAFCFNDFFFVFPFEVIG